MKNEVRFYQFDSFLVNASDRFLQDSKGVIPLAPKVFDTLLVLIENSGQIVSKDTLMKVLWPDTFVEESSLSQNIFLARRALGDLATERQYIETIPKRGYRFIGSVTEVSAPGQSLVPQDSTRTEIVTAADDPIETTGRKLTFLSHPHRGLS